MILFSFLISQVFFYRLADSPLSLSLDFFFHERFHVIMACQLNCPRYHGLFLSSISLGVLLWSSIPESTFTRHYPVTRFRDPRVSSITQYEVVGRVARARQVVNLTCVTRQSRAIPRHHDRCNLTHHPLIHGRMRLSAAHHTKKPSASLSNKTPAASIWIVCIPVPHLHILLLTQDTHKHTYRPSFSLMLEGACPGQAQKRLLVGYALEAVPEDSIVSGRAISPSDLKGYACNGGVAA
jgi:hypothetical protein